MDGRGDRAQRLVAAVRMRDAATVMHLDADAFFAAVEQRDKPSLRGKPVLVGGVGGRGVVSTASYEARRDGARSAMPMARARRLSPAAAVLTPRFAAYSAYSAVIMGVLRELTPGVEPLSIDEAFADLAQAEGGAPEPEEAAARVQARVAELTGLTVSVGVGRSKLVAKIASDLRKPAGVVVVRPEVEDDVLLPLEVRVIPGVGPATAGALERLGVRTVADLRRQPLDTLTMTLGEAGGTHLFLMARGLDDRPVVVSTERKSAGAERTFAHDLFGREVVLAAVEDVVDEALQRLERHGGAARTVVAKVRYGDFSTVTRSVTFSHPTASAADLRDAARRATLAAGIDTPVRLLGVSFHNLAPHAQLALDLHGDLEPRGDDAAPAAATPDLLDGLDDAPDGAERDDPADGSPTEDATTDGSRPHDHPPDAVPAAPAPRLLDVTNARPGLDVEHATLGRGWVVHVRDREATVRFETATTPPARSRVLDLDADPLALVEPVGVTPPDAVPTELRGTPA
ncbi:DNA polymerase IV [Cellulomonas sp. 179-A 9B4 NHS]|uniref:DNA polymerase IV n=1 Tax=Cellulomonas sp. 179-A 9B4 NHS TaxID=3142379 RepID=UPI0039A30490